MKYGVTSEITAEGTINPDFSQVESDAFQVEVNQRFPLFFSEKRPFFMEGLGNFELAGVGGDADHAHRRPHPAHRRPACGELKTTGSAGPRELRRAGRRRPGPRPPARGRRPTRSSASASDFYVARGQYSLGRGSYVGAILTDTEFADGHNRVAGADVSVRWGRQSASATFLTTRSRVARRRRATRTAAAGRRAYSFESKSFGFAAQGEHYDRGFQMDTAFLNQVGITQGWAYAAPSLYPDAKKYSWFKRVVPFVFFQYGRDRIQGGDPWIVVPGIRMHFTRQGFLRIDTIRGEEPFQQEHVRHQQHAVHRRGPGHALAVLRRAGDLRPVDLLRRPGPLPRAAPHPGSSSSPCSRARASTRRSPTTGWPSTARTPASACTP